MTRRFRRLLVGVGAAAALAGGLYLSRELLLPRAAEWLDVSERPRPAAAAYILGGGSEDRPFAAAALYRAGLVGRVVHPGVATAVDDPDAEDGTRPPEAVLTRGVLLARGVPAAAVEVLPGEVRSTADEAAAVARYLAVHPGETMAVVTYGFHTRRTRLLFRRALGADADRVYFVATPSGGCSTADWWKSEAGFVTYTTEYLKLALAGGW